MRLFHWFSKRTKRNHTREGGEPDHDPADALGQLRCDLARLNDRLGTVDIAIRRHDDELARHEEYLKEHAQKFQTLEQKVSIPEAQPVTFRQAGRHATENSLRLSAQPAHSSPAQHFDIEQFTEQQKRLLAIFFQNKGRRMSYADVATLMNKSACTIKNQMNQIRQKADLFDCTIGNQSRNLFALKADLRVEKYLKVGQPTERSVSMPERDQSEVKPETQKGESIIEYAHERSEPEDES